MIYICADDYGLDEISSSHILQCAEKGSLNKISIFPNFKDIKLPVTEKNIFFSLHLNLVEGKCVSEPCKVKLIADKNGNFRYSFIGLYKLSLIKRKEFEKQIYEEIKAQINLYKSSVKDIPIMIDSHQHTHMIPTVFKMLSKVIREENISVSYLRIPAEPVLPFLKTPSLYLTYSPVNIIKQWLLKFFHLINLREIKKLSVPSAYFFGILFSGKMDEKRVEKVLPHFLKKAEKNKKDIEILFHPGFLDENKINEKNIAFLKFYYSEGRKIEFNTAMNIKIKKEEF